jgi:FAD/FMN-containing dehydrogenase
MEGVMSETSTPGARISTETLDGFRSRLRGRLIGRGDPDYHEARKVHNGMIDRRPALIAQCRDVADVIACVNFGRDNGITVAVRGGGHSAAGLGVCDEGLVIDLSPMNGVWVDPTNSTVRAQGGCVWGDVDHATHAFGMATPSGFISTTGVGGLTLGGGIGNLSRGFGLTIDNLLSVDMVLADGSFITASATENEDLFWAISGGGGNFGVVTSFQFRLHAVGTVYAGPMLWPIEDAREVMQWWRDFILAAPEELGGWFAFLKVPPGPPFPEELHKKTMCGVVWCYTGPMENAEATFAPIRSARPAAVDFVGPLPFPVFQSMFDPLVPKGIQSYWRADFYGEINDEAIERHLEHAAQIPTLQSTMHLYPIDGAVHRVDRSDTAFSYRDANWAGVIVGFSSDPGDAAALRSWTVDYWEALRPYTLGGAYINFMMDEGLDRIKATYRDNFARLLEIKQRYDPSNFFHVNQNVRATG